MKAILVWVILCIIWGTTWIFIKLGLPYLPPFTFAATRFTLACLLLIPILKFQKINLPRGKDAWSVILMTGILQFFVNYGMVFWGEQHITSGLAAVLQATIPVFGLILARMIAGEPITGVKIISILLGLLGIAIIFREQLVLHGSMALLGSIALVVGAFCGAAASVLTKAKAMKHHPAGLVFGQMLVGHIPLWITALASDGNPLKHHWTPMAIGCVLYLAIIGTVVAFWLYYWLLTKMEVTTAMMIAFVTPVFALLIGSFFGEKLAPQTLLGGVLILASVFLNVIRPLLQKQTVKTVT